jgi:hypothetical protein
MLADDAGLSVCEKGSRAGRLVRVSPPLARRAQSPCRRCPWPATDAPCTGTLTACARCASAAVRSVGRNSTSASPTCPRPPHPSSALSVRVYLGLHLGPVAKIRPQVRVRVYLGLHLRPVAEIRPQGMIWLVARGTQLVRSSWI